MYLQKKRFKILISFSMTVFSIGAIANGSQNVQVRVQKELARLETSANGRIGVYIINTVNNQHIAYHANQRFPLCSTNKIMGVAAILKASEKNRNFLHKAIRYQKSDLVVWSPETKKHVGSGMTVAELCKAAITLSDNTAINLIMAQLGGPKAVTRFARSIGDNTFRLDRQEPALNTAIPGDLRDTSTPEAMAGSLRKLVLGQALAFKQRQLLRTWLIENKTGDARIRAGTPKGWIVGDKTGTCGHYGATNDVGIIWPKEGAPIVIAVYFIGQKEDVASRDDVIAKVTRIILDAINQKSPVK